jgi:AcrR family transcriptional regulator
MPRREPKHRGDTKDRILAAALDLFGDRGYNEVTLADILRHAGVSKGAFYYYFRDRRDVVAELQRDLWTRLRTEAATAYDPQADAITNIKSTFHRFFSSLRNLEEARFFLREAWNSPDVDVAARALHEEWTGQTARFLKRAIRDGQVLKVDADVLAAALIGAFSETTLVVLTTGKVDQANEVLDRMIESVRAERS